MGKDINEVRNLKDKKKRKQVDKDFIKATSYDLAGEIGKLDNEDMMKNKYINSDGQVILDKYKSPKDK